MEETSKIFLLFFNFGLLRLVYESQKQAKTVLKNQEVSHLHIDASLEVSVLDASELIS